jgi:hypothetical protein
MSLCHGCRALTRRSGEYHESSEAWTLVQREWVRNYQSLSPGNSDPFPVPGPAPGYRQPGYDIKNSERMDLIRRNAAAAW